MVGMSLISQVCFTMVIAGYPTSAQDDPLHFSYSNILRTTWWRLFEEPSETLLAAHMVTEAQALLIRGCMLRITGDETDVTDLVLRAKQDHDRIAAVGAGEESAYVPSEALARADFGLEWLRNDPPQDRQRLQQIAHYAIAFAAINAAAEDAARTQAPKFRYWDNTVTFRYPDGMDPQDMDKNDWYVMSRDEDGWSTPVAERNHDRNEDESREEENPWTWTRQARNMVTDDLVQAVASSGLTDHDFDRILSVFADNSLEGSGFVTEIRNRHNEAAGCSESP